MTKVGDDLELRREAERATHAKRLMEDPTLIEAFEKVRQACVDEWRLSKDPEVREGVWVRLKTTDIVWTALEGFMRDGKVASHKLKEIEKQRGDAA